ncbi:MAG: BON domain-containing protein [Chloroflexi bacterium]|nr:BON domain-containing protein [Chloroflexota bacterium]
MAPRSDGEIVRDVQDILTWDSRILGKNLIVEAANGVVSLSGQVNSPTEKIIAVDVARKVKGVKDIVDRMQVSPSELRPDRAIAADLVNELLWDPRVEYQDVVVKVASGVATLLGTATTTAEKRAAVEDAWATPGVLDVVDKIVVMPAQARADAGVKAEVAAAIARDDRITEPTLIWIKCRAGTVYLRGGVLSPTERQAAEKDAWAVGGVAHVRNELAIAQGVGNR